MRGRAVVVAVVLAASGIAACGDGVEVEPDDPPASALVPGPDPAPGPADEPEREVPEIFRGQLYPPLPDFEPDERGGDVDLQREVFTAHAELYEVVESGLTTNELNEARVTELAEPGFRDLLFRQYAEQRDAGQVSLGPDSTVEWLRVSILDRESAAVLQCVQLGPMTGGYVEDTGEPGQLVGEDLTFVRTFDYARRDDGWRATGFEARRLDVGCEEAPGA